MTWNNAWDQPSFFTFHLFGLFTGESINRDSSRSCFLTPNIQDIEIYHNFDYSMKFYLPEPGLGLEQLLKSLF